MSIPKPFVSDERINDARAMFKKLKALSYDEYVAEFFAEGHTQSSVWMRSLYEPHVQQLVRERDDLRDALDLMRQFSKMNHVEEVIYDDSGECRITKFTLHEMVDELLNTPPSNG